MNKTILLSAIALLFSTLGFSQIKNKMMREGVVKGIVYVDGKEIHGYIKKIGNVFTEDKTFPAPWAYQSTIKFIPKEVFENSKKIKNRLYKKYRAKDCDGYMYDNLSFETVKYSDMSAVGINMIPKKMFMRKVVDDKISIFFHYSSPPAVASGPDGFEPHYIECGKENVVYRKGKNGKLKLVNNLNIKKELNDCPYIVDKYGKKDNAQKTDKDETAKKKSSGLVRNFLFREDFRLTVIEEYNNNCQ